MTLRGVIITPEGVLSDGARSDRMSAKRCAARPAASLGLYAGEVGLQILADLPAAMPDRFHDPH
jgi:hypothetical protein